MDISLDEILSFTLVFSLNPIAWAVVTLCAIRSKAFWIPIAGGVLSQIVCIIAFAIQLEVFEDAEFSLSEILVMLFTPAILSGLLISTLVFLFVRQRRLRRPTPFLEVE